MSESDVSGGTNPGVVLTGSAAGERVTLDPEKVAQMSEHEARIRRALDTYSPTYPAFAADLRALLRDLDEARAETHFQACLVRDLLPYQDRAVKAEVDLARAKSELEEWQGIADAHLRTIHATEPAYIALAAKLARCEAMLVEGKGQIAACGNQGLVRRIDAYFAASEREPRT